MGFSPQQVDAMSMWQFMAAADGYVKANSSSDNELSSSEVDELWEWINS